MLPNSVFPVKQKKVHFAGGIKKSPVFFTLKEDSSLCFQGFKNPRPSFSGQYIGKVGEVDWEENLKMA